MLTLRNAVVLTSLLGCARPPSAALAPPPRSVPSLVANGGPSAALPGELPPPRADGRLPSDVRPTGYALDLTIDPAQPAFSGHARIAVTVAQPTRAIVMHGRGMTIDRAQLIAAGRTLIAHPTLRMAALSKGQPEELVLTFDQPAPAGAAEIQIDYHAPFADGLRGVYRVEVGGDWYAYTQFEPNDARRAFPGFDEPGHKTPFDLSLTVPAGTAAFANTRESHRHQNSDGRTVTFAFETSPPLPTYLVAFAVGPFDVLDGPRTPTSIRLVSVKGKAALGAMSVGAAAEHLALLGKYFDRAYPYGKLDVAAVPNFGAGAMENAGFITFREELLLLDPARASMNARRAMASVMAHELAHQWFGDLVTMVWWNDLWLNEAFASWMSDKIVDEWRPQTRARVYAVASKAAVMAEDALASVRRIRNPVRSTGEAEESFDAITYSKGRAVLSMTEAWVGEDAFRDGLRRYIKDHAWGNATSDDLFAALAKASGGRPVAAVMDSFTSQTGLPQVTASVTCPRSADGHAAAVVHLSQREYQTLDHRGAPSDKLWRIPVCLVYGAATPRGPKRAPTLEKQCTLLDSAQADVPLGATGCPSLVYPNAGEAGYYRVHLSAAALKDLTATGLGRLSERERFGVLSNAWAEVWSGELPATDFLALLEHFKFESSRLVWGQIIDALTSVDRALVSDQARPALARLVRELLGPVGRRLGWNPGPDEAQSPSQPQSDDRKLLREAVLGALGSLGDDDWTLKNARRVADAWLSDPTKVDPDLARIALPLAARRGDAALFERLRAVHADSGTPETRLLALAGLSGFEDPALVERTLGLILDRTIKVQDLRYVFFPLATRRATRDLTFAWMQRHFDELTIAVPAFLRRRFIGVAGAMCDRQRVQVVETFLRPRLENIEGAERTARQSVEEGLRCAALAEKEGPATARWLTGRASAGR
jgi:alanyl aminopeptidase